MTHLQKKHSINGFMLSESLYPPRLRQPRHTHSEPSFSFVLAGNYIENYGRQTQTRQPSTVVFHPPQESHAVDFQSGARILSVRFDSERFAYIRSRSIVLDASASLQTETIAWLGNKIYQEFRRMDSASALAIEGLIFETLAEAVRSKVSTAEKNHRAGSDRSEIFCTLIFPNRLFWKMSPELPTCIRFISPAFFAGSRAERLANTSGDCASSLPAGVFPRQPIRSLKSLWRLVSLTKAISPELSKIISASRPANIEKSRVRVSRVQKCFVRSRPRKCFVL